MFRFGIFLIVSKSKLRIKMRVTAAHNEEQGCACSNKSAQKFEITTTLQASNSLTSAWPNSLQPELSISYEINCFLLQSPYQILRHGPSNAIQCNILFWLWHTFSLSFFSILVTRPGMDKEQSTHETQTRCYLSYVSWFHSCQSIQTSLTHWEACSFVTPI